MSPGRRAAGCCARRHDNQRFRLERWTFARNLEGATPRGFAPDDHPDAGVPVVRDHESDEPLCTLTATQSPDLPGDGNPKVSHPMAIGFTVAVPGSRPRRVVVPDCKRDAKPDTSRVAAGNRSTHIAPPDEPVERVCRPVAAALSGTSLYDPESFAPRKRHPPGEPRAAHFGEWSCLSSRDPLRPKTRRTRNPWQPGAA